MLGSCIRIITTEINVGSSELVQKIAFIPNSVFTNYDKLDSGASETKRVGRCYSGCGNVDHQTIQNNVQR